MSEFSLINRHCYGVGADHPQTILSVGDDAAVISIPSGMELAVSTDTMVEGVHFFADVDPGALAEKLLAVNLSDMAAMGAEPKWATVACTIPSIDEGWLATFFESFDRCAKEHGVQLVGGDTTQGPLVLSLQIMGLVPQGQALKRSGAQVADTIYVSGTLGDAALALSCLQDKRQPREQIEKRLLNALERPQAQVALGSALRGLATACIDISDGLIADLQHVATASQVSMVVDVDQMPLSKQYQAYLSGGGALDLALNGGDDYQLAFTANPSRAAELLLIGKKLGIELTPIGTVTLGADANVCLIKDSRPFNLGSSIGFQHFGANSEV